MNRIGPCSIASCLISNKPFAVRVADNARATVMHSLLFGNAERISTPKGTQNVKLGTGVLFDEPKVDSAAAVAGDPDVRAVDGGKSHVGPGPIAGREGLF